MFASKCQGECHAVKAALCDLGDPGWGDCCFPHPLNWPMVFCLVAGFVFGFLYGPASPWHTSCHVACTEMILSYHLALIDLFHP